MATAESDNFRRDNEEYNTRPQIVYGLLCNLEGCPVAMQCFAGNVADPDTLTSQVASLRERYGLQRVAMVGDRGMIAQTHVVEDSKPAGSDWITALRHDTIRTLAGRKGIQPGLFDSYGFASVTAPDFPGERLLVCYNPLVAAASAMHCSTRPSARCGNWPPPGRAAAAQDGQAVRLDLRRGPAGVPVGARLDGLYVIRTSLTRKEMDDAAVIAAYKSLARVERSFRSLKTMVLPARPIFHLKECRVRAHVFLCMLAYYLEWHLRRRWAPLLFAEEDAPELAQGPVGPAARGAEAKERTRRGKGCPCRVSRTCWRAWEP